MFVPHFHQLFRLNLCGVSRLWAEWKMLAWLKLNFCIFNALSGGNKTARTRDVCTALVEALKAQSTVGEIQMDVLGYDSSFRVYLSVLNLAGQ
jgi:hypothetical protein